MLHKMDVLLSTYNGAKYLAEQLDSVIAQEFTEWHLIIRDDGSSDKTIEIINKFANLYPSKITFLSDTPSNLGPAFSFSILMQESKAPYIAFCDQDDVWLPGKLKKQMEFMRDAEEKYASEFPLLVHSDLRVVDENLSLKSHSFWDFQHISPKKMSQLEKLLLQNYVTGCSMLINRPLIELSLPIPKEAIMHDWWITLMGITKGQIIDINESTLLYRQHDKNDTGAKQWGFRYIVKQMIKGPKDIRANLLKTRSQALALLESETLDKSQKVMVKKYIDMFEMNWISKRKIMLQYGFIKHGFIRNMGMFLLL